MLSHNHHAPRPCFTDEYILAPVVPVEYLQHTPDHPFCGWDPSCPCHEEDQDAINTVYQHLQEGLLTEKEATRRVQGKTI